MIWGRSDAIEKVSGDFGDIEWGECVTLSHNGGVAAFHDYQPKRGTIELSAVGKPGWLTRGVVRELGKYAYGFCRVIILRTGNETAVDVAKRLGFEVVRVPNGLGDRDEWICTLTKEAWEEKWA